MNQIVSQSRTATLVGGWCLVVAAIGFMVVFGYLGAKFDYPEMLDGTAADVLPRLLALGDSGRAVWVVYAMLPFLLIPAGLGVRATFGRLARTASRAALVATVVAAVSMMLGLARWPSMQWELARAYATAPAARPAIDAVFRGLNVYLGNYIGEFVGEISLSAFFALTGYAALRSRTPRWFGYAGILVGVVGLIAAMRNVTSLVSTVAAVNNYLLPAWLVTLGVLMIRWRDAFSEQNVYVFG